MATVKALIAYVEGHGYGYHRTSSNGYDVYLRGSLEVRIPHMPNSGSERDVRRTVESQLGLKRGGNAKGRTRTQRRVAARKARREAEERKEAERRDAILAEREAAIARAKKERAIRDAALDGYGKNLTNREALDVARVLERRQRESRDIARLMTSIPSPRG